MIEEMYTLDTIPNGQDNLYCGKLLPGMLQVDINNHPIWIDFNIQINSNGDRVVSIADIRASKLQWVKNLQIIRL